MLRIKNVYCTVRNAHLNLIGNLSNCLGLKSTKIFQGKNTRDIYTSVAAKNVSECMRSDVAFTELFGVRSGKGLSGLFEDTDTNDLRKARQVLYGDGQERVKGTVRQHGICMRVVPLDRP